MNGSKPNLTGRLGRNYVRKETLRKFGRQSHAWRPTPRIRAFCVFVNVSPASSTPPNGKDRRFRRRMTWYMHFLIIHEVRNFGFFTCRRRVIEKVGFLTFCGGSLYWVVCNSDSTEHQICTQRSWIIGGEVVDVLFGVITNRPQQIRDPNEDQQTHKNWGSTFFL